MATEYMLINCPRCKKQLHVPFGQSDIDCNCHEYCPYGDEPSDCTVTVATYPHTAYYPTNKTFSQGTGASGNDGYLSKSDANYATAQAAATSDAADTTANYIIVGQVFADSVYSIYRSIMKFDTSGIQSTDALLDAQLLLRGYSDGSATDFLLRLQKWTTGTPITVEDYNDFDGTSYDDGLFNTSQFQVGQYNTVKITNLNLITKAGNTQIFLRSSRDISAIAPTGNELVNLYSYDSGYPPTLQVTYRTTESEPALHVDWLTGLHNNPENEGEDIMHRTYYCSVHNKYYYKTPITIQVDWDKWLSKRAPRKFRLGRGEY